MPTRRVRLYFALLTALRLLSGPAALAAELDVPPPPTHEWTRLPPVVELAIPEPTVPPHVWEGLLPPADEEDEAPAPPDYWFWPYSWLDTAQWDGSLEIGLNGTEGNSEAFTLRTGGNLKRKTKIYEIGGDLTYLKTSLGGVESQHRLLSNTKYERFLGESRWSYFIKTFLEYDEFKAFDLRLVANTGLGYPLIRTDTIKLKGRMGAGASREFGGPDDEVAPEAVFGGDFDWVLTDRQKVNATTDYYPQWDDFADYRMVTTLNWEVLLDKVANLSLKLSVSDRYDSTPNGRRPNDIDYGLLLLWKI